MCELVEPKNLIVGCWSDAKETYFQFYPNERVQVELDNE